MKFLLVTILIGIIGICAATVGLFELPDAFFYHTLGQYLYTGIIHPIFPFNTAIPQTLFSPTYGLFAYPIIAKQPANPLFVIPFIQLCMVGLSAFLLSKVSCNIFSDRGYNLAVLLFLLLPFNLIYAFVFMSETITMFFVSIYIFTYTQFQSSSWRNGLLVLFASILVLTRYAFLPLFALTFLILMTKNRQKLVTYLPAIVGLLLITCWILFHVYWYRSPQLSTFTGRHIYNNVITVGGFIPKYRSDPKITKFFSTVPEKEIKKPWWEVQPYFGPAFRDGQITEIQVDKLFLAVSLQGIIENPIRYGIHLVKMAIITPNTPPYHDNVLSQIGFQEKNCPTCTMKRCRIEWIPTHCLPIIPDTFITTFFGYFILGNTMLYPIISSVLMIISAIGMIRSVISNNKTLMFFTVIFLGQHFFQSATEWVEGRFLIPLYPIYAILIFQGIKSIIQTLQIRKS